MSEQDNNNANQNQNNNNNPEKGSDVKVSSRKEDHYAKYKVKNLKLNIKIFRMQM